MSINTKWRLTRPSSGMIPTKMETFKGPLKFARVGHSNKSTGPCTHDDNLASPWWLSIETLEHLWGLARNSESPLSNFIRQQCCIPYYWNSSCDLIYEVELMGYIDAWVGPGTFFFPENHGQQNDSLWPAQDVVFHPSGQFPQIYIPGLWDKEVRQSAWSSATFVEIKLIEGSSSYYSPLRKKIY